MDILKPEIKAPTKSEVLGIRLESTVLRRLEALAKQRGTTASGAGRLMIKYCIETMEPKRKAAK